MTQGIFAPAPRLHAPFRLFCLPYAGGSSTTYLNWAHELDLRVELVCVDLPGRGRRFDEVPIDRLDRLVEQLCGELLPWLDRPFCLFGHSNGALVAFELARRLQQVGSCPEIFFASAKNAPSLVDEQDGLHTLSDAELIEELRDDGATPTEFFKTPELLELFLPVLRADFALSGTYQYQAAEPIAGNLVMLGGAEDECMNAVDREAWSREFTGRKRWQQLPGGHFFIKEHPRQVIGTLNQVFTSWLQAGVMACNTNAKAISSSRD
jgi:medium-chain acyl-[acyl-carrier-protein] hydrolase